MILHVDMDAFYASVEEREQPQLRGKPLIVGGTPGGRGVVAAASYAARTFGIHSAMPTSKALRLCPDVVVLQPRMDFYANVSCQIREIFHRYTPLVEPLSLDEAFLDATGSTQLFGSVEAIAKRIKDDIRTELNLIASVGVAPNKFLAKLASDLEKPDGFTVIREDNIQETLDPLSVSRIWGIGKVTQEKLERIGVRTIGELRSLTPEQLTNTFGQHGQHFWNLSRGVDHRHVIPDREAQSISHETTFATDVTDSDVLRAWLMELTEQVARRLRASELMGRTVHLKVRFSNFDTITRARSLPEATSSTGIIWKTASELLASQMPGRPLVIRLLGVGVSRLQKPPAVQGSLFDQETSDSRDNRLDQVADQIRSRFGTSSLRRASVVEHDVRHRAQPRPDANEDTED